LGSAEGVKSWSPGHNVPDFAIFPGIPGNPEIGLGGPPQKCLYRPLFNVGVDAMPTGGPGLFLGKCHFSDFWWSCYSRKCTFPGFREIPEKHDHPGPWVFWWALRGHKTLKTEKTGEKRQFPFGVGKKRCHFRVFGFFRALFGKRHFSYFFDVFRRFSQISPKNDFSRVFWSPALFFDPPTQNPMKSALFRDFPRFPRNPRIPGFDPPRPDFDPPRPDFDPKPPSKRPETPRNGHFQTPQAIFRPQIDPETQKSGPRCPQNDPNRVFYTYIVRVKRPPGIRPIPAQIWPFQGLRYAVLARTDLLPLVASISRRELATHQPTSRGCALFRQPTHRWSFIWLAICGSTVLCVKSWLHGGSGPRDPPGHHFDPKNHT